MNSKLLHLFDALEQDRINLIVTLKSLPPEKLQQSPEGKWPINQILSHLIAAEKLSIQYLNKKILGIKEAGNTGIWEEIKLKALQISQRLPLKFKAPQNLVDNTPSILNFNEITIEWEKTRAELKALLEKLDDTQIKKKIYKHFFVGRLNIQHALIFLREHIIHHQPQINRLLK